MAIDMARLQRRLAAKEDKRNKPYLDTEGKLTGVVPTRRLSMIPKSCKRFG